MFLRFLIVLFVLLIAVLPQASAQDGNKKASTKTVSAPTSRAPETYTGQGISIEFSVEPGPSENSDRAKLMAGGEAIVRFKIVETSGSNALGNLRPAAWIDQRQSVQALDDRECREKVQAFLQPSFSKRPTINLNSYFILALNQEPNISVIDPLSGFGGSKLYTLIPLRSAGEDWLMSADQKRLYVSMPDVNQVAVIDIPTWKPLANIDVGLRPTRLALQHDGRYLWIGNDASEEKDSGITVMDTATLKVAAQVKTGLGHHEIAFSADDSSAFVTNKQDGTLSKIDMRKLTRVKDIKVGSLPVSVAFSPLSTAVYVASEADGTILVLDGVRFEIITQMKAQPGLRSIRLPAEGRFGFAVNPVANTVAVFDLSANKLIHSVPVGAGADQIAFTKQFVYVRSSGDEFVTMIKIADLGKEAAVSRFPAGQKAPKESPTTSLADAVVPAPEEGAVLVANPADKMIYFYMEGMAAPMGSFQNYRRSPRALLVLDNSLRETARGVYSTTVRLGGAGNYDAILLLDSPRLAHCFHFTVAENPALSKEAEVALKIERLSLDKSPVVGEGYNLRFRVSDAISSEPKANVIDLGVLVFLAPGIWQERQLAKSLGDGVYEINFVPPQAGVYYLFIQSPSLKVQFNQTTPLVLEARKGSTLPSEN